MDIVVFGAGSLGSLIGGLLSKTHEVTLVGRQPHVDRINASGLAITGLRSERVKPRAQTDLEGIEADLALVTVKSYDTEAAARALATASIDTVCSLQNGLGNEEILADTLDCPIIAGTATYGADLTTPGTVSMTGEGAITIGLFRGGDRELLESIETAFDTAGVGVEVSHEINITLWEKLVVNAAINPVTALARCRNGSLVNDPLASIAEQAAIEAVSVAQQSGIDLDEEVSIETVFEVAQVTADNRSSMLQDVLASRRTEIDAINGTVVDRAGTVPVPVNETLAGLLVGWEREHGIR